MTSDARTLTALTELATVGVVGYAVVTARVDATLGVMLVAAVVGGPAVVESTVRGLSATDESRKKDP